MYNEKLKMRFINDQAQSISYEKTCVNVFNAIEKYEVAWDADICTRTSEELIPVMEEIVGFRIRSKWSRLILLKKYIMWCVANGVPGAINGIDNIEFGLGKVRSMTVFGPEQLQYYMDQVFEPVEENTIDNTYRCFYWLAFAGMDEEDITKVTSGDVDFDEMVVHYNNEDYIIYREAIPAFKSCATLNQFLYKHPNYPKPVWRSRVYGDILMRGIKAVPSPSFIRTTLSRDASKKLKEGITDKKLSYYRVWLSGMFYRMFQRESIGIPVNFDGLANRTMEGKTYKLDTKRGTINAKRREVSNDYYQDYERWKAAHLF